MIQVNRSKYSAHPRRTCNNEKKIKAVNPIMTEVNNEIERMYIRQTQVIKSWCAMTEKLKNSIML